MRRMFEVIIFYKYVEIKDPQALKNAFTEKCSNLDLKGRVLIAAEGVNATLEGTKGSIMQFEAWLTSVPELSNTHIKRSDGDGNAFPRLSVKVRNEIVGTRFPSSVDPTKATGKHIKPSELEEMFATGQDFTVIDMRNSYEIASGYFEKTVEAGINDSRDLIEKIPNLEHLKNKKVVTVCTSGVRCEKMSALLLENGFNDVLQLEGGIHEFMQQYPGKRFKGTLYTFDGRHTMHFGGDREIVGKCAYCSESTEQYVNCSTPECRGHYLACTDCVPEDRTRACKRCTTNGHTALAQM